MDSTRFPEPVTHAQFMVAAARNDVATLRRYLEQGGNIDIVHSGGAGALVVATRAGHKAFLAALLAAYPRFDGSWRGSALEAASRAGRSDLTAMLYRSLAERPRTVTTIALHQAIKLDDLRTVRCYLAQGDRASLGETLPDALLKACDFGRYRIAALLLSAGADPHSVPSGARETMLEVAADRGDTRLVRLLLAHPGADVPLLLHPNAALPPLLAAARAHRLDVVRQLLDAGAKPYTVGYLAAHFAVQSDVDCRDPAAALATLKVLLGVTSGADLDAFSADNYDRTLLHVAAKDDASWAIDPLVEHGLTVDAVAQQWNAKTPFLEACAAGSIASLRRLAAHGADIAHRTAEGLSALTVAIEGRFEREFRNPPEDVIACLLELGCDPDAPDQDGAIPRTRVANDAALTALIGAYGARKAMQHTLAAAGQRPTCRAG